MITITYFLFILAGIILNQTIISIVDENSFKTFLMNVSTSTLFLVLISFVFNMFTFFVEIL